MSETLCPQDTWKTDHTELCGKRVVRDGLCGLHANAKARRDSTRDKRQTLAEERREQTIDVLARLRALNVTAHHVDGVRVTVDIGELERLAGA